MPSASSARAEAAPPELGRLPPASVFTVPPGQAFLPALARAILAGDLPCPGGPPPSALDLAGYTLLLPTRRATRGLQAAFLAASGGRALLLPRIRAIAEGDEEATWIQGLADRAGEAAADIPPAIGALERRLTLTRLVLAWAAAMQVEPGLVPLPSAGAQTPAQAALLAAELARLMDMVETEGVDLRRLADLVPDTFSEHWQRTLVFLRIVTEHWPRYLTERGCLSPAERRNRLILAEARRLRESPPRGPVIVAGVTGSVPATAQLMAAVSLLRNGAIVLPGLDQVLDEASWRAIVPDHPEHPQFGLSNLLDSLGLARIDVQALAIGGADMNATRHARAEIIGEAMRPAATTERWHRFTAAINCTEVAAALAGVSLIEAPTAQDEAEAIALIMREVAETPARTAALVTPDRLLARRVAIRLEAWGIRVDDSAGRPLPKTVPGTFLDLLIGAAAEGFAPAPLMALLKHPLTRLGLPAGQVRRAARMLELAVFRRPYLGRGLVGIDAGLERAAQATVDGELRIGPVRRAGGADWQAARDLVQRLTAACGSLERALAATGTRPLAELVAEHIAAAEAVAAPHAAVGASAEPPSHPLWHGEAGEAASLALTGLLAPELPGLDLRPAHYPDLYRTLVAGETVRARQAVHTCLFIWGPYEARLQQADVMILGALVDGTWPAAADPGPWLNRPMRKALRLPSPEEAIGRAAHDFCSFLGAERVYLTRAAKVDGVPTVASRWLLRLQALLDGIGRGSIDAAPLLAPDQPWLAWARARNRAGPRRSVEPPRPKPPVAMRPRRISVTEVERWMANPYAIFARHILRLDELPALGVVPGAAARGEVMHDILGRFGKAWPRELPPDPVAALSAILGEVIEEHTGSPRVAAFWLPRFERFVRWFAETEADRRAGSDGLVAETAGTLIVAAPGGPFELRARADRIDLGRAGLVITDYKTGAVPSSKRVEAGLAPQLPLEAAIAIAGGFAEVPAGRVATLRYVRASGGEPPGAVRDIAPKNGPDATGLATAALAAFAALVTAFDDPATPYAALRQPRFAHLDRYDAYAHLARVAEWSGQTADDADEDDGEQPA